MSQYLNQVDLNDLLMMFLNYLVKVILNLLRLLVQVDHEEIIERLKPIIFKSKYQTHHVFAEGDLLMMDQFTTLHRRTPVMGDRLLWRVACDYKRVCN